MNVIVNVTLLELTDINCNFISPELNKGRTGMVLKHYDIYNFLSTSCHKKSVNEPMTQKLSYALTVSSLSSS